MQTLSAQSPGTATAGATADEERVVIDLGLLDGGLDGCFNYAFDRDTHVPVLFGGSSSCGSWPQGSYIEYANFVTHPVPSTVFEVPAGCAVDAATIERKERTGSAVGPHVPHADDRDMRDRFRGAFLGCALGDAIGRPFEMMSETEGRLGSGLDALLTRPGRLSFSDDTQMMISVAESLVRVRGVSDADMMAALAENYDPARGYGRGMRRAIEAFERGQNAPAAATWVEGSRGSGGAVRVVAIACAHHGDMATLAAVAEEVASLTHAHPIGRAGAVVHALALAKALGHRKARIEGPDFVTSLLDQRLVSETPLRAKLSMLEALLADAADTRAAAHKLGNGVLADESVPLALFSFLRWAPDFASVVRNAVLCGGDTDTIAAMSGALCGALAGESAIPANWLERLENGPKGRDHVRALADSTFDLWSRRPPLAAPCTRSQIAPGSDGCLGGDALNGQGAGPTWLLQLNYINGAVDVEHLRAGCCQLASSPPTWPRGNERHDSSRTSSRFQQVQEGARSCDILGLHGDGDSGANGVIQIERRRGPNLRLASRRLASHDPRLLRDDSRPSRGFPPLVRQRHIVMPPRAGAPPGAMRATRANLGRPTRTASWRFRRSAPSCRPRIR